MPAVLPLKQGCSPGSSAEGNPEDFPLAGVQQRLREQATRKRSQSGLSACRTPRPVSIVGPALSDVELSARKQLQFVERCAAVGLTAPELPHLWGLKRILARFVNRCVLSLTAFLTGEQRQFNQAALDTLRMLQQSTEDLQQATGNLKQEVAGFHLQLQHLRIRLELLEKSDDKNLASRVRLESLENEACRIQDLSLRLQTAERRIVEQKSNTTAQERRISVLLEELRKRLDAPIDAERLRNLANEDQHSLDTLYLEFEDKFRGSRVDIKERLREHLPLMRQAPAGEILDLGCGRGEWVELLQNENLMARGIDSNRAMIDLCQQAGLSACEADVISHLRGLASGSLAAVTGFHIIEHLPLNVLLELLDETVRVLQPGGLALFETPNPANVHVGSCNFYLDPTHRNPLPSPLVKFLAESRGLSRVEVRNLHAFPASFQLGGTELAKRFSEYFYGPQDYAVVGWKV